MSIHLKAKFLSKSYKTKKVLNNISFDVFKGNILGLVGKNGAGKSTILKILSSLIDFGGDVFINKKSIKNTDSEHKKNVGYLSENNPLYMDFYIQEYLTFIGNLNGLFKDGLEKRKLGEEKYFIDYYQNIIDNGPLSIQMQNSYSLSKKALENFIFD